MLETICMYIVVTALMLILVSMAVLAIFFCVDFGHTVVEDIRKDREKRNKKGNSDLPRLW